MSTTRGAASDPTQQTFDCRACGACCCAGLDVLLLPAEASRYEASDRLARLLVWRARIAATPLPLLRHDSSGERCLAYRGRVGGGRCSIYADRPELCREFEPGSDPCLEARRRFAHIL